MPAAECPDGAAVAVGVRPVEHASIAGDTSSCPDGAAVAGVSGSRALVPVAVPPRARSAAGRRRKARRVVRWSAKREELFLAMMAGTGNVQAAIRASGLSETNVYRRRRLDPGFAARWEGALSEAYVQLEAVLLERAMNGVEKTVWHGGKAVGTMREYSDRIALGLLTAHRAMVLGQVRAVPPQRAMDETAMRAELGRRLRAMNKAMGGNE